MPRFRNSLNFDGDNPDPKMTRRGFLSVLGLGAAAGAFHLLGGTIGSFLYPNALKTAPSQFSIGKPSEVLASEGKIFLPKYKTFIEVNSGKIRAQTAVCTHLGCTVNAVETGYSCPCHGSTYNQEGFNTGGPAKVPLVFYEVFMGPSGDLLVNKAKEINDPKSAWYTPIA